MPVLGICNGFQILCEAGLLPGALTRNGHLHFRNRDQALRIERADTAWTRDYEPGQRIVVPVKNGEGNFRLVPAAKGERGFFTSYEGGGRFVTYYLLFFVALAGLGSVVVTEAVSGEARRCRRRYDQMKSVRSLLMVAAVLAGSSPMNTGFERR